MSDDEPISLGQAARLLPKRNGKRVSANTVWRWSRHGHRGVRLEAERSPSGEWLTSAAAVGRFLDAVTRADDDANTETETRRGPA